MTSPEFQLCVECCKHAFTGGNLKSIRALCPTVEWARFTRVVRYHRVQGLVWASLVAIDGQVPQKTMAALRCDAESITATNLRLAFECQALRSDFEKAGVALLFVKGLAVGALAYANPMLKMGWDIDLLVDPNRLADAGTLLRSRGYRPIIPPESADLQSWHQLRKESVWGREDGLHVELHSRLAEQPELIPKIDVHAPSREIEIVPGISLRTLAKDEMFAYLCVHGASSLWFRLKWITDLAAILNRFSTDELERLYNRSQELRAGRASSYALLLADDLYGSLRRSKLRQMLERDRTTRWLQSAALRQLAGRKEPIEPTSVFGGTAAIHYTQFLLLPGIRYKLSEFVRQARTAIT